MSLIAIDIEEIEIKEMNFEELVDKLSKIIVYWNCNMHYTLVNVLGKKLNEGNWFTIFFILNFIFKLFF
jgi:hypothetical protein